MPIVKSCVICGVDYETRGRALTCSRSCSKARRRQRDTSPEYKEKKRVYASAYQTGRWATDDSFRAERLRRMARKYANDEEFRKRMRAYEARKEVKERKSRYYHRRKLDESFRARRAEQHAKQRAVQQAASAARFLNLLNNGDLRNFGSDTYFVYRFFNGESELMYVGITNDPEYRFRQHERDKDWFSSVSRADVAAFANETEARAAERILIRALRPVYNIKLKVRRECSTSVAGVDSLVARFKPIPGVGVQRDNLSN